jgi:NCAIR mutase (PurE)-related protein
MKKNLSLQDKAVLALKEAVRGVVENHKRTGRPLVVWKNGKVVKVRASSLSRKTP